MVVLAVVTITRFAGLSSDLSTLMISGIAGLAVASPFRPGFPT
jgi:hypothetical protein